MNLSQSRVVPRPLAMDLPFPAMTNLHPDAFLFTVPLTDANHQIAQQFYAHHSDPRRAKHVYLNTLSIQAVHFYLTCIGLESDLNRGMSWNPTLQALMNTADLWVNELGPLECCVVLPDMEAIPISVQAIADRIGFVAVRLNADLTEADVLGFVPTVEAKWAEAEWIPFAALQSLDGFPAYLTSLAPITQLNTTTNGVLAEVGNDIEQFQKLERSPSPVTHLTQWLIDTIGEGWHSLEGIMEQLQEQSQANTLAYSFRHPLSSVQTDNALQNGIKRGKFLTVGDHADDTLLFIVGIQASSSKRDMNITVELYPPNTQPYLPETIHLAVMDETGKAILQAEGGNSEGLEFQFSGEPGEQFSVKVSVHGRYVIEDFQV